MRAPTTESLRARQFGRRAVCAAVTGALLSGCSTMVGYAPQVTGPYQTVKYADGVGTLSVKDSDEELFMYSRFRLQGPKQPVFSIGYANNTATDVVFTPDNVKAFFRGVQVPIYSYAQKSAEIQDDKRGKQIALAILGGLAAGAAAYGASHQTYTSSYSGSYRGPMGLSTFSGSNTLRVYDPVAGMLVGTAIGGATFVGVRQLEYNAGNLESAARSILQANTVGPQQMITGDVILKDCCDPYPSDNDVIRFEVTTNGRVSVFEFVRSTVSK